MSYQSDLPRLARLAMRLSAEACVRRALDAYEIGDDLDIAAALNDYEHTTNAIQIVERVAMHRA